MNEPYILIVYYSKHGATENMARQIARGVDRNSAITSLLRTVPDVSSVCQATQPAIPATGAPYVSLEELEKCSGLILGSPTRFGNMAAPMKYFLDTTSSIWLNGQLAGKPAGVFTSSSTFHGGQESTLLSMMLPLLHHGAYIVGLPYTEEALNTTSTGGTPYGPSHVAGLANEDPISPEETQLCQAFGQRIARLAQQIFEDPSCT